MKISSFKRKEKRVQIDELVEGQWFEVMLKMQSIILMVVKRVVVRNQRRSEESKQSGLKAYQKKVLLINTFIIALLFTYNSVSDCIYQLNLSYVKLT